MLIVVDPSFAAAWLLPDEANGVAEEVARRLKIAPARVPHLFRFELRNLLYVAFTRGRIDESTLHTQIDRTSRLPVAYMDDDGHAIIALAAKHKLTT